MTAKRHTRTEAWTLLNDYTQSPSLLKHALAVEACMGAHGEAEAARRGLSGEEAMALSETYRSTGLLHDFDYEKYPSAEEHPFVGNKILAEQGWPEEIREAIMGHAQYSGVARTYASGQSPLCLRRTGRFSHRRIAGQADQIHLRRRRGKCAQEDER